MARQRAVVRRSRLEPRWRPVRDEIRANGRRRVPAEDSVDFDSAVREYQFDDWTPRGFNSLDHNRDNRITADEWHFDREGFVRADHNRDGVLTRAEFLNDIADDD